MRKALTARVASLKVNRPKVASSTSQFMKFEIALSSPSRHCGGISLSQLGIVPSGTAKEAIASAANAIHTNSAGDALVSRARSSQVAAAVIMPPWPR